MPVDYSETVLPNLLAPATDADDADTNAGSAINEYGKRDG